MKRFVLATLVLSVPALTLSAFADNVGGCGWGSKLMDGNRGIAPQILAVTTNGFLGNQTFGISSGTSGCTQDGVVKSSWKLAALIEENKTKFARDLSLGEGETLKTVANLLGVTSADDAEFRAVAKANFSRIMPRENSSTEEIIASLRGVLAENARLSRYAAV